MNDKLYGTIRLGNTLKIGAFPGQSEKYNIISFDSDSGTVNFSLGITPIFQICGINEITVCRNHVSKIYDYSSGTPTMRFDSFHLADENITYTDDVFIILEDTYPSSIIYNTVPQSMFLSVAEIRAGFGANTEYILRMFGNNLKRFDIFENNKSKCPVIRKIASKNKYTTVYDNTDISEILSKNLITYDFILFNMRRVSSYEINEKILKEVVKHLSDFSVICFIGYENPQVEMLITDYEDIIPGKIYAIEKGSDLQERIIRYRV